MQETPLFIGPVNIVDCSAGRVLHDHIVVIDGKKIQSVLPADANPAMPEQARVIRAQGKYLMPGLWDMHVHWSALEPFPELYIANGVTGVRDMGLALPDAPQVRQQISDGKRFGPRIVSGSMVDGPHPTWRTVMAIGDELQARQAVRSIVKAGGDFVKTYSHIPRKAFLALADESIKANIHFAGHVPLSVGAAEASEVGQRSQEHLLFLFAACSTREEELRPLVFMPFSIAEYASDLIESYDDAKARALFERLIRNDTWQCPTLLENRAIIEEDDSFAFASPLIQKYMPADIKDWNKSFGKHFKFGKRTARDNARARMIYTRHLEFLYHMKSAGVNILAGTDSPLYCVPGFSLHDELRLLVEAGLTPMEALQSATSEATRFLELKDCGNIEPGKTADLVMLNADPTTDINNTRQIEAVFLGGRYLERSHLDSMLEKAESLTTRPETSHPPVPRANP